MINIWKELFEIFFLNHWIHKNIALWTGKQLLKMCDAFDILVFSQNIML